MASEKGKAFETRISKLLKSLANKHPEAVEVREQFKITLHNGQIVIPDFRIRVRLIHERRQYLMECQDRARSKPDIAHKIKYMRDYSMNNTFIFVYSESIPDTTRMALENDGVMCLSAKDLIVWTKLMDYQLALNKEHAVKSYLMGSNPFRVHEPPPLNLDDIPIYDFTENTFDIRNPKLARIIRATGLPDDKSSMKLLLQSLKSHGRTSGRSGPSGTGGGFSGIGG